MIHLHVHSEDSMRESIIRIPDLVQQVKDFGQSAVALTDHGNMSGSMEFYMECLKQDIKPIIGTELYVVPDVQIKEKGEKRYHLVLLALNREGYQNLLRISSMAGTDGFYYVPRADLTMLKKHRAGLVCLTGCISSALYMEGNGMPSERLLRLLRKMYHDRVYLEIMPHTNLKEQKKHNLFMQDLANKTDTPMVITQDCHYLDSSAREAHDVLMRMQGREPYTCDLEVSEEKHIRDVLNEHHGYLSKAAVASAMLNTRAIAAKVQPYELPIDVFQYPKFLKGE